MPMKTELSPAISKLVFNGSFCFNFISTISEIGVRMVSRETQIKPVLSWDKILYWIPLFSMKIGFNSRVLKIIELDALYGKCLC